MPRAGPHEGLKARGLWVPRLLPLLAQMPDMGILTTKTRALGGTTQRARSRHQRGSAVFPQKCKGYPSIKRKTPFLPEPFYPSNIQQARGL